MQHNPANNYRFEMKVQMFALNTCTAVLTRTVFERGECFSGFDHSGKPLCLRKRFVWFCKKNTEVFSVSKNELGNAFPSAMWLSPPSAFLASVGDPLECAAPGATPFWSPIESLLPDSSGEWCVQRPASDSASSSAKYHSQYWAVFIKGRHELSLNFDCSHYQNAATEILLAETIA